MNLIEKYGSYDAAKAKQQELSKIAADPQLLLVGKIIKEIGEIEIALLEYRRQHNIFEVGDKVVSKNGCELVSEITYLQGVLAKIKNEKFDHVYSLQDFRHATNEEIKAGKRLEVKSEN